jgi:hypothetical protein
VLSYDFVIATDFGQIHEDLGWLLEEFRSSATPQAHTYRVIGFEGLVPYEIRFQDRCIGRARTAEGAIDFLLWHINRESIQRSDFVAVHAAAATWDGSAIVLPAPMDSGKSTLVAGLVRAGWDYLSDEAALIDPFSGKVQPWAKPLGIHETSMRVLGRHERGRPPCLSSSNVHHVRPQDLRSGALGRSASVKWVVAPRYLEGGQTTIEPVSPAEAVVLMAQNCFKLDKFGTASLEILSRVVSEATCWRLQMGDLDDAIRLIGAMVASPTKRR